MSRQAWRYQTLPENTAKIKQFCKKYDFEMKSLNNGYQLRIEGVLDLYPVRAKYHNLTTDMRGEWETLEDLRKIMIEALPRINIELDSNTKIPSKNIYRLTPQPQVMNVISMPVLKKSWLHLMLTKIRRLFK